MPYRAGDAALLLIFVFLLAFGGTLLHTLFAASPHMPTRSLVRDLGLTDLALVTEARYTRHPSLADRHAPFQDHPMALEHFPSGAVFAPSPHLVR